MDKEFLMDYEAREKDEIKKFVQKFREGKIRDRFPSPDTLKLNEPYTKSIAGEVIWSQIPLYGTTIITLKPIKDEIFEKVHGFDVEDIDRLIDYAKETGRVQFTLAESPRRYIKMDFLEPVFRELQPPKLTHIPLDCIVTNKEIKQSFDEMRCLLENPSSWNFIKKYVEKKYYKTTISQNEIKQGIIDDLIRLKLMGYEDSVKEFTQSLTAIDTTKIISLLDAIHDMFFFSFDPLKGILSFKRQDIQELHEHFPLNLNIPKEKELPCEVGKFLNHKLKLISPKNLNGAVELSDEYELYDIRRVMGALSVAVEKEKIDVINEKSREISVIFENVWSDADKLKGKIDIFRFGISFGIGVIGVVATLPISGTGGLLSGLGFAVADKVADVKAYKSISERIAKWRMQSYVMHVYDFKKKYKLL